MTKKTPAQKKADAAFMAKLSTLNFVTKHSQPHELSALAQKYGVPEKVECVGYGVTAELIALRDVDSPAPKHDDSEEVVVTE